MKTVIALFCALPSLLLAAPAKTFFMPRAQSSRSCIIQSAWEEGASRSLFSLTHTAFYNVATSTSKLTSYFLGGSKKTLLIDEAEAGDINSEWLDVRGPTGTPYASTISFDPVREAYGVVLRLEQRLPAFHEGAYVAVTVPVCKVRHSLGLSEVKKTGVTADVSSGFTSILDSLESPNRRAARMSTASLTLWGSDDVLVQLGMNFDLGGRGGQARSFVEGIVPTGESSSGTYLFEPVQGSAGHAGVGFGVEGCLPMVQVPGLAVWLVSQIHYRSLFASTQLRTPDLRGQAFSRYLVYMDVAQAGGINFATKAAQGANFFTRPALVQPGGQGEILQGVRCAFGAQQAHVVQLGYAYWWRQGETAHFATAADRFFATPLYGNLAPLAAQQWLPSPLINEAFIASDSSATTDSAIVYDHELDVASMTAPSTATHQLQLSLQTTLPADAWKVVLETGGAYEWADNYATINSWTWWGRVSLQW